MAQASNEGHGSNMHHNLTGKEKVALGKEAEERFARIMETKRQQGHWPSWLTRVHQSTNIEDKFGADFFAHIEVPWGTEEVVLQIKRSRHAIRNAKKQEREGERKKRWEHITIEVHPERNEINVFERTIAALSKERERMLEHPPEGALPLPRFITEPPRSEKKSDE